MNFDVAVNLILDHEGGYVWDKADPGGETNWGISKRAYPNVDIKNLTKAEAKAIYKRDYWNKVRGDSIPFPVAVVAFDMAVNMGVSRSIKMLQSAVGTKQDGVFGDLTLASVMKESPSFIVERMTNSRIQYYADLPTFPRFKGGWIRRSVETLVFALTMGQRC